jgi:hypothetical protein
MANSVIMPTCCAEGHNRLQGKSVHSMQLRGREKGHTIAMGIMTLLLTLILSMKGRHSSTFVSLTPIDPVGVETM